MEVQVLSSAPNLPISSDTIRLAWKKAFSLSSIWEEFQQAARNRRRNPVRLLEDYMRQCLADWEDQTLDQEIQRDVLRGGHAEEDAVDIVLRHRLEKSHRSAR